MNTSNITNYKPKDFAGLLGVSDIVNDGTNEGLKYTGKNIFTVQYHPEACPGPLDSGYLFDRFLKMMEVND